MITTINEFRKINESNFEEVYISFLNKDKNFKEDKKTFKGTDAYEQAVKWGKENLEKFNHDMIHYTNESVINEETHENVGDDSWDYFLCDDHGCSTEWNIPIKLNKGTSFTHSFGHFKVTSYEGDRNIMCDKIGNLIKDPLK